METLLRDLGILWRAESIVAELQLRQLMARSELRGFATVMAIFALFMLNLAGYFGLEPWSGSVWAAVAVAAIDLAIATILLMLASTTKPSRDLDLAREVRQAAVASLEVHAREMQHEIVGLRDEICAIRGALARLAHNPLDTLLPAIVVPMTRALVKALHRSEVPASSA